MRNRRRPRRGNAGFRRVVGLWRWGQVGVLAAEWVVRRIQSHWLLPVGHRSLAVDGVVPSDSHLVLGLGSGLLGGHRPARAEVSLPLRRHNGVVFLADPAQGAGQAQADQNADQDAAPASGAPHRVA